MDVRRNLLEQIRLDALEDSIPGQPVESLEAERRHESRKDVARESEAGVEPFFFTF